MEFPGKIAIGCDHAGFDLKEFLKADLESRGIEIKDFGTASSDSVDYPDFAHAVAESIEQGAFEFGILICGTANGIAMSANKHQGIRAAIVWNESIAKMARSHNNANIVCFPARVIAVQLALDCTHLFMTTDFEGGRHQRRVSKISC